MWFIIVIFSALLGELMGSGRSLPNINHEASMSESKQNISICSSSVTTIQFHIGIRNCLVKVPATILLQFELAGGAAKKSNLPPANSMENRRNTFQKMHKAMAWRAVAIWLALMCS